MHGAKSTSLGILYKPVPGLQGYMVDKESYNFTCLGSGQGQQAGSHDWASFVFYGVIKVKCFYKLVTAAWKRLIGLIFSLRMCGFLLLPRT